MPLRWLLGAACALSDLPVAVADTPAVDPAVVEIAAPAAEPTLGVDASADDAVPSASNLVVGPLSLGQGPSLPEVIERVPAPADPTPSTPASVTGQAALSTAAPREAEAPAPRTTSRRRKVNWLGPLGITGIVVGAVGLGGVAISGVFLARGRTVEVDPTDARKLVTRDYEQPGWIFYGAGLAVTTLGATALALDVTVGRDRRARRMRLQPQLGRAQAGLAVLGRF